MVHRFPLAHGVLCVSSGSVVEFSGDVVVNAANRGCQNGGGVDGAIIRQGGYVLRKARSDLRLINLAGDRCRTGEAVITVGGGLRCTWCVHAVGPNYAEEMRRGRTMDECDALCARAYAAAMKLAQEKGAKAVGFSLLCAGIFRGEQSLENVLREGVVAIQGAAYPGLQEVHLVCFTDEELSTLLAVAKGALGTGTEGKEDPVSEDWGSVASPVRIPANSSKTGVRRGVENSSVAP